MSHPPSKTLLCYPTLHRAPRPSATNHRRERRCKRGIVVSRGGARRAIERVESKLQQELREDGHRRRGRAGLAPRQCSAAGAGCPLAARRLHNRPPLLQRVCDAPQRVGGGQRELADGNVLVHVRVVDLLVAGWGGVGHGGRGGVGQGGASGSCATPAREAPFSSSCCCPYSLRTSAPTAAPHPRPTPAPCRAQRRPAQRRAACPPGRGGAPSPAWPQSSWQSG